MSNSDNSNPHLIDLIDEDGNTVKFEHGKGRRRRIYNLHPVRRRRGRGH